MFLIAQTQGIAATLPRARYSNRLFSKAFNRH
jgi:hypothetical protein